MIDRATKLRSIEETQKLNKGGLMLGATLRVNFIITDLCRSNIGVSNLVLDTNDRFIEAMFIVTESGFLALRQEGHVEVGQGVALRQDNRLTVIVYLLRLT